MCCAPSKGLAWVDTGYLFTTRHGTPLEPRNLTRDFRRICEHHGLRRIRLHALRHSCVSLLLALGVHPRVVMEVVGTASTGRPSPGSSRRCAR